MDSFKQFKLRAPLYLLGYGLKLWNKLSNIFRREPDPKRMANLHKFSAQQIYSSKWVTQENESFYEGEPIRAGDITYGKYTPIMSLVLGFPMSEEELLKVEVTCRRALKIDPQNAGLHNNLGYILSKQGRLTEAEAEYQHAFLLAPDNADLHNNFGAELFKYEKFAEAESEFEEAVWLDPNNCSYHLNLGRTFHLQGKLTEAEAEYKAALTFTDYNHTAVGTEEILKEIQKAINSKEV